MRGLCWSLCFWGAAAAAQGAFGCQFGCWKEDVCHPVVRCWGGRIDEGFFVMIEWEGMRGLCQSNL